MLLNSALLFRTLGSYTWIAASEPVAQLGTLENEATGTFLIGSPNGMSVEFVDGTIFELINTLPSFDGSSFFSGRTTITLPVGTELLFNGTADMKGKEPYISEPPLIRRGLNRGEHSAHIPTAKDLSRGTHDDTHRNLAVFSGNKTVLVVRVVVSDGETTPDETLLSDSFFGNGVDPASLASQYSACSYGKLNFVKAANKLGANMSISNGVVTVRLPSFSVTKGYTALRNAITRELNADFDVPHPTSLANHVIYCLPGQTGIPNPAYANYNSWNQAFNNEWCTSLSLQMHEMGHSLSFGHSNEKGTTYEDETGMMGYSYPNKDGPQMCFNGAKSWQTRWYANKSITIRANGRNKCFSGDLHGVSDYPAATTVLLRIRNGSGTDYYVNFNAKRGINIGTQEGANQVTITSKPRGPSDSYDTSELIAKLGAGKSYNKIEGYTINVVSINNDAGTAQVAVLPTNQERCIEST